MDEEAAMTTSAIWSLPPPAPPKPAPAKDDKLTAHIEGLASAAEHMRERARDAAPTLTATQRAKAVTDLERVERAAAGAREIMDRSGT
jgi:hypothetical protein